MIRTMIAAVSVAVAAATCTETQTWSCYTVADDDFLFGIAEEHHVNPNKLCDYNINTIANCSMLYTGDSLRVPKDACVENPGGWTCHDVTEKQGFWDVSKQFKTISGQYLMKFNEDVIYSDMMLYRGMQLRIPEYHCAPSDDHFCYTALEGEDVYSIGKKFGMNAGTVAYTNYATVLNADNVVYAGMELSMPKNCVDSPGKWFCYKVRDGDTVYDLSVEFGVESFQDICTLNGMSDCNYLTVEDNWLKIPIAK